jgi:hypothetical protein
MLPFTIVFALRIVDAAISFDNEALPRSAEVGHESANHELTTELDAVQLPIPQHVPQDRLRPRRYLSELARPFDKRPFHQRFFLPLSIAKRTFIVP